jgi:uncharacterized membrane protein YraQ (UPF0718 family)
MKPAKRDYTPFVLAIVAVALAIIAWDQGGTELVIAGLRSGGAILLSVIPLLIAAFLTAGLIQALVTRETVSRWLGSESGWRGIALACLGGALIPGGPYAYYPIAAALLQTGAGVGVLVAFVSAKNLWSFSRLPVEFALLGPNLTIIRFVVTLAIPPLLGFIAETLFGKYITNIRLAMRKEQEIDTDSEVPGGEQ